MEATPTSAPQTALAVFAHPDDETFVAGGLLARLTARGAKVTAVSATAGEGGTDDPETWPPHRLAAHRRIELALAMEALGVSGAEFLGVPDGRCIDVPHADGVALVAERVAAHRPDLVITFGPDGWTGHDDHRAVSAWTTEAASRAGVAVLQAVIPASLPAGLLGALEGAGAFYDGYPCVTSEPADREQVLSGEALEIKLAALACHQSQTPLLRAAIGDRWYTELIAREAYRPLDAAAAAHLATALGSPAPERVA